MRAVVVDPAPMGPNYSRGQELELSPDRFARWLRNGWIRVEAEVAPPQPLPPEDPPKPPAPAQATEPRSALPPLGPAVSRPKPPVKTKPAAKKAKK